MIVETVLSEDLPELDADISASQIFKLDAFAPDEAQAPETQDKPELNPKSAQEASTFIADDLRDAFCNTEVN